MEPCGRAAVACGLLACSPPRPKLGRRLAAFDASSILANGASRARAGATLGLPGRPALLPSALTPSSDGRSGATALSMPEAGDTPAAGSPPPFTSRQFRDALAQFATGVTVI